MIVKIGHRGARGYAFENSLESFEKALKFKVDRIEFDVHTCKSGEVIVIHDSKINRVTNGKGYIRKKTFQELQKLKLKNGQNILKLEDVLDFVNRRSKLNIELKGKNVAQPVFNILRRYIKIKRWKYRDFIVFSSRRQELLNFRKLTDKIEIEIRIVFPSFFIKFAKKIGATTITMKAQLINKIVVKHIHKNNLLINAWVVNNPKSIKRIKRLGVDGVMSDFPDRI